MGRHVVTSPNHDETWVRKVLHQVEQGLWGVFLDRKVFRTKRTKVRVFLGGSCIRFELQATWLFLRPCVRTVHEWHLDRLGWQAPCYWVRIPGVRIGSDELTSHDPQIIRDPKLVSW